MSFDYKEMSAPFELKGNSKKAALLIHGFLATPYIMRSLAKVLNNVGYNVKAICLAGHGTKPKALRKVYYQDWQNQVNEALEALQQQYTEVIIVGFSLGAILGLIAAFNCPIQKMILLAPAFKVSNMAHFFKFISPFHLDLLLPDLRCTQSEKTNLGSYKRFPVHGVAEVQKAIDHYHLLLPKQKSLPQVYVVSSVDDATVKFSGILEAMDHYTAGSRFRIYTDNPAELPEELNCDDAKIVDVRQFDKVLAFSHVALLVAANDPYFGQNGKYYAKLPKDIEFGEPTWRDRHKKIRRLTYNPDFNAMSQDMLTWLSDDRIAVVIGIVMNPAGEFCLAERPSHVHLGGLWEFPGGKLEKDEKPLAGLKRELHEELGIEVMSARPFMTFPYDYATHKVDLDFWLVEAFKGEAHGKEGQKVHWVKKADLLKYNVPNASLPVIEALQGALDGGT